MAKRFRFRLETVLRLRRRRRDDCQRVVAARLRQIQAEQAQIDRARAGIAADLAASRDVQVRPRLDVAALRDARTHIAVLHGVIQDGEQRLVSLQNELEGERAALVQANVALKAIEKLRERRLARHVAELDRQETVEQNELGINAYLRQRDVAASVTSNTVEEVWS